MSGDLSSSASVDGVQEVKESFCFKDVGNIIAPRQVFTPQHVGRRHCSSKASGHVANSPGIATPTSSACATDKHTFQHDQDWRLESPSPGPTAAGPHAFTDLASSMAGLSLYKSDAITPLSPAPPGFRTPMSSTAYTPTNASWHLGLSPPRTPEERLLRLLADGPEEEDVGPSHEDLPAGNGTPNLLDFALGKEADNSEDEGDASSGDELDQWELEQLGLTPLSVPGSLCRTPVDDVIDLMLLNPDEAGAERGDKGGAPSPVPYTYQVHEGEPCKLGAA